LNLAQGSAVSTNTDVTGTFRFPALAPGYYDVTASVPGFTAVKFERVEVLLGQIKRLSFVLEIAAVAETVRVSASSPLVDVRQSARGFSIRQDTIDLMPKGRDFTSLVTQAPSANFEPKLGGISIDGSSASENRFIIDGVETTDLVNGLSGKRLLPEFVDEIQLKTSGYTAEYGGSTGGVINVVTRSGANEWHGDARLSFQGDALEGGPRRTLRKVPADSSRAEYITYPEDSYTRAEPGFAIGGPIKRDRAWLFAAYQPALTHTARTVTFTFDKSTATKSSDVTEHYFSANQTAQLSDGLRTRVAFNWSPSRQDGFLPALDGSTYPKGNFDVIDKRQNYTLSGSADWVATPKLYVGARAGYYLTNHTNANVTEAPLYVFQSDNHDFLDVPPDLQQDFGFRTDLTNDVSKVDRLSRVNAQVDGTYYGSFAGRHMLKAGVQLDRRANDVDKGASANVVNIFWDRSFQGQRGRYGNYRVQSNPIDPKRGIVTTGTVSDTTVGLFVQDAWTVHDRLTVNAGLRTENETVPFYNPTAAAGLAPIHFSFGDKLAPRVGAAWDVAGDGRWKVHGSWGVFYDIFKLTLPQSGFGGLKFTRYIYTLDTYDWPSLVSRPGCPPACPGRLIIPPVGYEGIFDNIDPALDPMRLQEATVGVEHQLSPHVSIAARYVHKQLDRAIDDTGFLQPDGSEGYVIANPGEGLTELAFTNPVTALPKAKRNYDSVELAIEKRFADNWYLRSSYLWSRLYGNYTGLSQSDENGRTAPNVGRAYDYPMMMFQDGGQPAFGPLPTDRPSQFKTQLIYQFNFGTSIGVNQYLASGLPVSREIGIFPTSNYPVQYLGRGSDGRTPTYSQTDLLIQQNVHLGGTKAFQVYLNVLNLFNQDTVVNRFVTYQKVNGVKPDENLFYTGQQTLAGLITSQNIVKDPRFLMDNGYQLPIAARVGVKFLF